MSRERDDTYWVAILNDDRIIREYEFGNWNKLMTYCSNDIWIKDLYLCFRTEERHAQPNATGYYFTKSLEGIVGSFFESMTIGWIENDNVSLIRYRVPEFIEIWRGVKTIEECKHKLIVKI